MKGSDAERGVQESSIHLSRHRQELRIRRHYHRIIGGELHALPLQFGDPVVNGTLIEGADGGQRQQSGQTLAAVVGERGLVEQGGQLRQLGVRLTVDHRLNAIQVGDECVERLEGVGLDVNDTQLGAPLALQQMGLTIGPKLGVSVL